MPTQPTPGQGNVSFGAQNRGAPFPGQNFAYPGQAGNEAAAQGTTASNDINAAGSTANQLGAEGASQYSMYNNALNSYLRQYASAAGVGSGLPAQATFDNGVSGSSQPNTGQSPFTLTPNETQYTNSQVDALGQAKANALNSYESQLSNSGQLSPTMRAEGAAVIGQHFDQLINQTQSGAQLQQQQEVLQNLGNLMNLAGSEQQQGAAMQDQSGSLQDQTAGEATNAAQLWSGVAQNDAATNPLGAVLNLLGNVGGTLLTNSLKKSSKSTGTGTGSTNTTPAATSNSTLMPGITGAASTAANTATPDANQLAYMQALQQQNADFSSLYGGQSGVYDMGV